MTEQPPQQPVPETAPPPAQEPPPQEPPAQEPWAARYGLVRPRHGRYIAGVCAAIGRATGTDPLLWRVLIGVLAIFGIGIVIYLAGWLVMPAEGDTASPVEALFGRGNSSTSAVLTLILGVIAVVLLGALTDSPVVAVIAAVGLVVAALAINPRIKPDKPIPVKPEAPAQPEAPVTAVPMTAGYQVPFAPHGPYASAPQQVPGAVYAKPKPEPSRLGRLIFGVVLLCVGALGLADMAGASVPAGAYVATALAVVGAGLIAGAWFGRARGFIALGLILSLLLPMVAHGRDLAEVGQAGRVSWTPSNFDTLSPSYRHRFGEATLDLTELDFTGRDEQIDVEITFGELTIRLPSDVDIVVISEVSFGEAEVFGQSTNGVGVEQTTQDRGSGAGKLTINLDVRFGHAEVTR